MPCGTEEGWEDLGSGQEAVSGDARAAAEPSEAGAVLHGDAVARAPQLLRAVTASGALAVDLLCRVLAKGVRAGGGGVNLVTNALEGLPLMVGEAEERAFGAELLARIANDLVASCASESAVGAEEAKGLSDFALVLAQASCEEALAPLDWEPPLRFFTWLLQRVLGAPRMTEAEAPSLDGAHVKLVPSVLRAANRLILHLLSRLRLSTARLSGLLRHLADAAPLLFGPPNADFGGISLVVYALAPLLSHSENAVRQSTMLAPRPRPEPCHPRASAALTKSAFLHTVVQACLGFPRGGAERRCVGSAADVHRL